MFHAFKHPATSEVDIPGLRRETGRGSRTPVVARKDIEKRMLYGKGRINAHMTYETEELFSIWQPPVHMSEPLFVVHVPDIAKCFLPHERKLREIGILGPHQIGKIVHHCICIRDKSRLGPCRTSPNPAILPRMQTRYPFSCHVVAFGLISSKNTCLHNLLPLMVGRCYP